PSTSSKLSPVAIDDPSDICITCYKTGKFAKRPEESDGTVIIAIPVTQNGTMTAVLRVVYPNTPEVQNLSEHLFHFFANAMALALENVALQRTVHQTVVSIESQNTLIETLAHELLEPLSSVEFATRELIAKHLNTAEPRVKNSLGLARRAAQQAKLLAENILSQYDGRGRSEGTFSTSAKTVLEDCIDQLQWRADRKDV